MKIIFDTDPGHDDIMAVFYALAHPELFDILGFATVVGNNLVEKVTQNMCNVLSYLDLNLPVVKGSSKPLVLAPEPQDAHGDTGLQGPVFTECHVRPLDMDVLEWYKEQLENNEKVIIFALAPLTNLANLVLKYPELKGKIDKICLMGGSRASGNILKYAEFNIYADPHAAKVVFESGIPIVMSDIEICDECRIKIKTIEELEGKGRVHQLAYEILNFFCNYDRVRGNDNSPVFDMYPVIQVVHPEYFETEDCFVEVVLEGEETRGQTIVKEGTGVTLLKHCLDNSKITETFLEAMDTLEELYG